MCFLTQIQEKLYNTYINEIYLVEENNRQTISLVILKMVLARGPYIQIKHSPN